MARMIFRRLTSFFRKERYFEAEKVGEKEEDLFFQFPDDTSRYRIRMMILALDDSEKIESPEYNLLLQNAWKFDDISEVIALVKDIVTQDLQDTETRAGEDGYQFAYFPGFTDLIPGALIIANRLFYPGTEIGDAIYNLISIKKRDSVYYVWNMDEE